MSLSLQQSLQALLGSGFELRRELHGGGMSRVFVAYEIALKRDVAVKVLPPDLLSSTSVARFRQEIEVTARLQHPHILPVVTTGGSDSLIYYVMPYIAGGSLRERLQSGELPTFAQGVRLTEELLAAIAVAHERGIVHRDIKPGNVLLSEGHAMLADFGISRALEAMDAAGHDGEAQSTSVASPEAYRAPERPRDEAADLYALAVLSFEMLTGTLPANPSPSAIAANLLDAHRAASPLRVRAVATVLARALSPDPGTRFQDARAFLAALAATSDERPRATGASRAAIAAGLALAVTGGWWATRNSRDASADERTAPAPLVTIVAPQGTVASNDSVTGAADAPVAARAGAADATHPAVVPPRSLYDSANAMLRGDEGTARRLWASIGREAPDYARAQLRLALLDAWSPSPPTREAATQAATRALEVGAERFAPRERLLAEGIASLGRHDFPEACDAFERAGRLATDYDSWMGLGECRVRDTVVTTRGDSIAFRSSYHEAARAYLEAIRNAPAAAGTFPFMRLSEVAYVERARVRRGWIDNARVVLGRPIAVGDSFAFLAFLPGQPARMTPEQTLAHNRAMTMAGNLLRPALLAHTRANPADARVRLLLVELVEIEGNIDGSRGDGVSALGEIEAARRQPVEPDLAQRLADVHLRLLLRSGRFDAAAALADSVLAAVDTAAPSRNIGSLFGTAMLGGRVALATRLYEQMSGMSGRQPRMRDGGVLRVPVTVMKASAGFTVAAALGVCNDDVRDAPVRLLGLLQSVFDGPLPPGAENAYLERAVLQALPCIGAQGAQVLPATTHPIGRVLLARTDAERAQWSTRLAALRTSRTSQAQFLESPEHAMLDAYAYLAEGDSAGAQATLSQMIDAVPLLPPPMLASEMGAGLIVRAMSMRAELAAAAGDSATARQYARAVAALWRHADESLQPVVGRMRALTEPPAPVVP